MERIELYSSRKKSLLMLIGSLLFVAVGIWMFIKAEDIRKYTPFLIKATGIMAILFFGFGVYVSIGHLIKSRLMLVIDEAGINIGSARSLSEKIGWEHIKGFSEIKIRSTKIIVVQVDNPHYWIDSEKKKMRKNMMKFNMNYCGSPLTISASSTRMKHTKLMELLNEKLNTYKNRH